MKYICLGYFDEKKWETMSKSEQNAFMDECFAYDDELRKNGHWVAGGELDRNDPRKRAAAFKGKRISAKNKGLPGKVVLPWP
jgi:hypothetical protein